MLKLRCLLIALLLVSLDSGVDSFARRLRADEPVMVGQHVRVTLRDKQQVEQTIVGRVLVKAADGGLLIESADGRFSTAPAEQLQQVTLVADEFRMLTGDALKKHLAEQLAHLKLPGEIQFATTEHYVFATNGNVVTAEWAAQTLEKLHRVFHLYWEQQELKLVPAERPLIGLWFATQTDFAKYGTADGNPLAAKGNGYYSMTTNRFALFDFPTKPGMPPLKTVADAQRASVAHPTITATLLHEGLHQIAYNSGLHQRYSDVPVWLSEGMAMFFESIDLNAKDETKSVGRTNPARLKSYRLLQKMPKDAMPLQSLIATNERFAKADEIPRSYPEAWALTYFLLKQQPAKYVDYLRVIQAKPVLQWDEPDERMANFRTAFGDPATVQQQVRRFVDR